MFSSCCAVSGPAVNHPRFLCRAILGPWIRLPDPQGQCLPRRRLDLDRNFDPLDGKSPRRRPSSDSVCRFRPLRHPPLDDLCGLFASSEAFSSLRSPSFFVKKKRMGTGTKRVRGTKMKQKIARQRA